MWTPWPVSVLAINPVAAGSVLWEMGGALRATVFVKATFALVHQREVMPSVPDEIVRGERRRDDDVRFNIDRAPDTAPYLPSAGVVLTGHAHAPPGARVQALTVRLAVVRDRALIDKTLHVLGDRASTGAEPQPFQRMQLIGARDAGAPGHVVDPSDPTRPAGFGPLSRHSPERVRLLGDIDPTDLAARVPSIRPGFEWRYFHAAPRDQQTDFLRGDEYLVLDGLHPWLPRLTTRLASARGCARRWWMDRADAGQDIPLRADTLAIDTDRHVCSIVWRGHFVVEGGAEAIPLLQVAAGMELPGLPLVWPDQDALHLLSEDAAGNGLVNETMAVPILKDLPPPLPFSRPGHGPAAQAPASRSVDVTADAVPIVQDVTLPFVAGDAGKVAESFAPWDGPTGSSFDETAPIATLSFATPLPFRRSAVAPGGTKPPSLGPPLLPSQPEPTPASAPANDEAPANEVRSMVASKLRAGETLYGLDLSGAVLDGLDMTGAALTGCKLRGTKLRGCCLKEARLGEADLTAADLTAADLTAADLTHARLTRAILTDARLDGARLSEADLSAVHGAGATFRGASGQRTLWSRGNWDNAAFDESDLPGADFTEASLAGASLQDANLPDVMLAGARCPGATLDRAHMQRARNARVVVTGGSLRELRADDSQWERAVLDECVLDHASFARANLMGASCHRARMHDACFASANLQRLSGENADFSRANLNGADFRQARLAHASFEGANASQVLGGRADLSGARLVGADLTGASLRQVRLRSALLGNARVDGADLRGADLEQADLRGVSLATAKVDVIK